MKNQPIPLINGFYADETRPWSQQDVVNWLPCAAEQEGTRTPTMLKTPPGLAPFVQVSATTQPVRGIYNAEGRLFAVMGSTLYQIRNGVAIPLGTIPGITPVRFSHNQITNGNEVLIVNGSAGYIWNTVTQTLTRITDEGYPGAIDAVFIDGYFVQIEPARRFAFNSDLADGLNYNTLDRFTSEVSPDLLVGMAVSNNELLLLSEGTGEFFENTGAPQQPFRSKRITFDKGAASRYGIATLDNTVMWLGSDGVFYLLDGYSPRRISTRPIEQMIRGLAWTNAFAFVWEDSGHSVCYWTFPDGQTIGYDASQQKWHRRASYGLERWRPSCMTRWQNRSIAGDFQCGRLWELDWAYPWEGDVEFISEMTGPVLHDNQNLVQMPRLEVIMDTGAPEVAIRSFAAQPEAPTITGDAPNGGVNIAWGPYSYTLGDGTPPYVVTLRSGSLPPGIGPLNGAGTIAAGTPTADGAFSFVVRVTDANGLFADLSDSITVTQPMLLVAQSTGGGGADKEAILSPDGTTWNATPVTTGGALNDALYVIGLPGRYWGGLNAAVGAAYAPAAGTPWTSVTLAGNANCPGQAYSAGRLFIPGQGLSTNYRYSDDLGVTSSSGSIKAGYFAAKDNLGNLAALKVDVSPERVVETGDNGDTWSAGVGLPANMSFGGPGCSGWGGDGYYFGASNPAGTTPRLVRVIGGVLTAITLPTLTGATRISAFAYGNNTRVFGTDNGLILFDNGGGLTPAATTLPAVNVLQLLWNGAVFVALSQSASGGVGTIWTSPTGNVWTQRSMYAGKTLWSVAQLRSA